MASGERLGSGESTGSWEKRVESRRGWTYYFTEKSPMQSAEGKPGTAWSMTLHGLPDFKGADHNLVQTTASFHCQHKLGGCVDCRSDPGSHFWQFHLRAPGHGFHSCGGQLISALTNGNTAFLWEASQKAYIVKESVETPLDRKTPKISFLELHIAPNPAGGLYVMDN